MFETIHAYFVNGQATVIVHLFGHTVWSAVILGWPLHFLGGLH